MTDEMSVQFLGAARCVTGSKYLIRSNGSTTLVDCGLFQGHKELRLRNWEDLPFPPKGIDQVLITHAHIDHTGYLPRLRKQGFEGPVYCTEPTAELLSLLLPDCGHIQEEDARYAAKKGFSKHRHPLPLYTSDEGRETLKQLRPVKFGDRVEVSGNLAFSYQSTGHILGAASLVLYVNGSTLLFSGDLGRYDDEMMSNPAKPPDADYVFVEATYGNRQHPDSDPRDELAEVINRTAQRGGILLMPAFAIGRTQSMLYYIRRLEDEGRIPQLPVYIDSPMAVDASGMYCKFGRDENLKIDLTMTDDTCCALRCGETIFVKKVEASKSLNEKNDPCIIISASGMATGGRILHHLKRRLPHARNTILLVGYQAAGTRGRALLEGAEEIKIHGENVSVKAEVVSIGGLSAHGDKDDLLRWLSEFSHEPRMTFLIHGEDEGLEALQHAIDDRFRRETHIPEYLETISLGKSGV